MQNGHERNDLHDTTQLCRRVSLFISNCTFRMRHSATDIMSSTDSGAERLRKSRERKKEVSRQTSRRHREKQQNLSNEGNQERPQMFTFPSRMARKRAVDAVSGKLPKTPEKKAAVITSLINSPRTKKILEDSGVILSEEEKSEFKLFRVVMNDATSMIANEKSKRNDNSRAAVSIGIAMLCGESVKASGLTSAASTTFGINRRRIAQSIQRRAGALANREWAWL